jgi:hypothetical protein
MEITEEEALDRLRSRLGYRYSQKDMAEEFGVSAAFMSAVITGKSNIPDYMLSAIGVERKVVYRVIERENS